MNILRSFASKVCMKIARFEDLEAWRIARELTKLVYCTMNNSPIGRDFRLRDQMGAAALSVMNNVAEGFDSQSDWEFVRFLGYSRRSCSEVQNCLYVALDQDRISDKTFQQLYDAAQRARQVIDGLIRYLRRSKS